MGASFPEEGRVGLECAAEPPGSQRRLRRHFRTSRVRRSSPPRRIVGWAMHANLTQGWPRRRSPWRWRIATDAHGLVASINRPGPVPREEARPAIFDYIAAFYNRTRRPSSIGDCSPDHEAQSAVP